MPFGLLIVVMSMAVGHPYSFLRTCCFMAIILAATSIAADRHPCSFRQTCCFVAVAIAAITVSPCLAQTCCYLLKVVEVTAIIA